MVVYLLSNEKKKIDSPYDVCPCSLAKIYKKCIETRTDRLDTYCCMRSLFFFIFIQIVRFRFDSCLPVQCVYNVHVQVLSNVSELRKVHGSIDKVIVEETDVN